jgi:hypothetical protein
VGKELRMLLLRLYLLHLFLLFQPFYIYLFAQQLSFTINETGNAPFEPNFDIDSSGHFITVWQDLRHSSDYGGNEDGSAIYCQKFDMNGIMLGVNVRVDDKEIIYSKSHPDISINKLSGDFIVVWQKRITTYGNRKSMIIARILNSDFEPYNSEFIVEVDDSTWQAFPKVKYLENSNILIMWFENHEDKYYYFAKMFNKFGEQVTGKIMANANNEPGLVYCDLLPSTGFYFIWDRYLMIYDNSFTPITDVIDIPLNSTNSVKSISRNRILIVFRSDNESKLWGIVFNVTENTFGETFRIDDDDTYFMNTRGGSDIAVSDTGDFIVVWADPRNDNKRQYDVWDIYGQRFDKNVQPVGVNFKINHEEGEREQHNPKTLFCNNHFITIFSQGPAPYEDLIELLPRVVGDSRLDYFIIGSSQNFENPIPGPIYGWKYSWSPNVNIFKHPFPNPFNYQNHKYITFEFGLNKEANVCFDIFNVIGQKVITLISSYLDKGYYRKRWYGNVENDYLISRGIYFCRLKIGSEIICKKIIII